MKVGNIVSGLEVVDVKRVNKLNLIQFLKEVDSYLQQGYKIDVNSARQVGLVLSVTLFKTGEPKKKEPDVSKVLTTETSDSEKNIFEEEDVKLHNEVPVKKVRSKKLAE